MARLRNRNIENASSQKESSIRAAAPPAITRSVYSPASVIVSMRTYALRRSEYASVTAM